MSSHVHELLVQDTVSLFNIRGVRGHRWHWHHCYVIEEERIQIDYTFLSWMQLNAQEMMHLKYQRFSYPKPKLERGDSNF